MGNDNGWYLREWAMKTNDTISVIEVPLLKGDKIGPNYAVLAASSPDEAWKAFSLFCQVEGNAQKFWLTNAHCRQVRVFR